MESKRPESRAEMLWDEVVRLQTQSVILTDEIKTLKEKIHKLKEELAGRPATR